MKTCLQNCKPGDVIWWLSGPKYKVLKRHDGWVSVVDIKDGLSGRIEDIWVTSVIKIVKANSNENLPTKL